jgi:hypothetical protein
VRLAQKAARQAWTPLRQRLGVKARLSGNEGIFADSLPHNAYVPPAFPLVSMALPSPEVRRFRIGHPL